eukprot:14691466-Ditylum_brightwellii.AAC.1
MLQPLMPVQVFQCIWVNFIFVHGHISWVWYRAWRQCRHWHYKLYFGVQYPDLAHGVFSGASISLRCPQHRGKDHL